jgi:hypothetical protein
MADPMTLSRDLLSTCLRLLALVFVLFLGGCGPEATRQQGGGLGGDINNRPANSAEVEIHGQVDPAFETPFQGRAIQVQQE